MPDNNGLYTPSISKTHPFHYIFGEKLRSAIPHCYLTCQVVHIDTIRRQEDAAHGHLGTWISWMTKIGFQRNQLIGLYIHMESKYIFLTPTCTCNKFHHVWLGNNFWTPTKNCQVNFNPTNQSSKEVTRAKTDQAPSTSPQDVEARYLEVHPT